MLKQICSTSLCTGDVATICNMPAVCKIQNLRSAQMLKLTIDRKCEEEDCSCKF